MNDKNKTKKELVNDLIALRREIADLQNINCEAQSSTAKNVLQSNEERYRAIVENQVQFIDRYLPGGILTYVNNELARYVGMRPEDLIGKSFYPFLHKDDLEKLLAQLEALTPERPFIKAENRVMMSDGSVRWHQWIHQAFFDSNGKVLEYQSVGEDITGLKEAEEALRMSERRYSALFANKLNAIAQCRIITDEHGRPVDYWIDNVNEAYERIVGIRKTDIEGRRVTEVFPGVEKSAFDYIGEFGKVALEGGEVKVESYLELTGQYFSIYVYSPLPGEFTAIITDITERKLNEKSLQQSEERYRTLFDTLIEGFCTIEMVFDADGRPVDYRFLEINPAFETQTGLRNAQGRLISDLVPNNEAYWFDIYGKVALTGESARVENTKALGRYYDVCAFRLGGSESRKVAILFNDVTERKLGEQAMRDSEERFRLAQDAAKAGTWEWNLRSNENIWSEELWHLYGLTSHSVKPSYEAWLDTIHPNDLPAVEAIIQEASDKGIEFEAEWRVRQNNTTERWVMSRGRPIRDNNGAVERFIGIVIDITERKKGERERETTLSLLRLLNDKNHTEEFIRAVTGFLQQWSGCEAVGIRLRDGYDFPYFETRGFPSEFVRAESSLCVTDLNGQLLRDDKGNPVLECMCGNVLLGRVNPELSFFTEKGTFWTNSTTELLASTTEVDRQARTRNRCNAEGYESVALIPLRYGKETLGLLQLNDHTKGRFSPELITFLENIGDQLALALKQRQSQAEVEASEERFRQLAENIKEVFWIASLDLKEMIYVSPAYEQIWGRTCDSLYKNPTSWMDAIHPEDSERVRETAINNRETSNFENEYRIVRPDGSIRWIRDRGFQVKDSQGQLYRLVGLAQDITERKQAESAIRESEERFRILADSAPIILWIANAEGNNLFVNRKYREFFGSTSEQVEGGKWQSLIHKDDAAEYVEAFMRSMEDQTTFKAEARVLRTDRQWRWISSHGEPRFSGDGEFVGFVGISMDITEQKEAELERKKLEERLLQAQKMEAVGQLSGGIAHDFNNILSIIMGNSHLLLMGMDKTSPQREFVDQILSSSEKAASLTQSLLAFSRKQVLEIRPADINEIIARVQKLLVRLIGEDIDLQVETAPEPAVADVDSVQIEQVLMNLATNARDVMPRGGQLHISSNTVMWDEVYVKEQGFGEPGYYCCITVSDTGKGMDEETRSRIFEPFFTTKEVGKGTGLGLAMVYGIVNQHGGYITVDSQVGKGSTFKLFLPLVESLLTRAKKEVTVTKDPRGDGQIILLVEDNESVRTVTSKMLTAQGYVVIEAVDGDDAVIKAVKQKEKIDLIILDVIMPKRSGKEVYDELRRLGLETKVLFMSGYPAETITKNGVLQQGMHFLKKPTQPATLFQTIKEMFNT